MNLNDIFNKCTLILGAGATTEAGCLTSKGMLLDLEDKINQEDDTSSREVYYFLCACLEYQNSWKNLRKKNNDYISNIEDYIFLLRKIIHRDYYLPHPLIGNWSEKIIKLENKESDIFQKILNRIENIYLRQWLSINPRKQNSLLKPLRDFLQNSTHEKFILYLFTINYDLVIETYFNNEHETLVNDGFSSGIWSDNFDLTDHKEQNKYKINYYKLHGSLNWERDPQDPALGQIKKTSDNMISDKPIIIFGQEAKMLSIDPFLALTSRFREKLENSNYYFIIGYSFFDTYINNLILESVNKFPEKKLVVVSNSLKNSRDISDKIYRIQEADISGNLYNIKKISPDKVHCINIKASDFYNKYFSDGAKEFIKLYKELAITDDPF